ncbi:frizzled, partial [Elysia marginata]
MTSKGLVSCLLLFLTAASTLSSPLSQPASSPTLLSPITTPGSNRSSKSSLKSKCAPTEISKCSTFYNTALMPNVFGVYSQSEAHESLKNVLSKLGSTNKLVTSFLCTIFIPPCPSGSQFKVKTKLVPLPCKKTCEEGLKQSRGSLSAELPHTSWPVRCHGLPNDNCFDFD